MRKILVKESPEITYKDIDSERLVNGFSFSAPEHLSSAIYYRLSLNLGLQILSQFVLVAY